MKLKLLANQKGLIVIQNNMSKKRRQQMGFIKTKGVGGWTAVPLRDLEHYRQNVEPTANDNDIVEIGDWSGTKNQILQTKIDWFQEDIPETDHDEKDKIMRELGKEYWAFRREINAKTPEQKAERIEMFNLLYWGIKKEHQIPEDIKNQVIEIQTKFFKENPKRIYCEPILFRPVFGEDKQVFLPALSILERAVSEDKMSVKFSS